MNNQNKPSINLAKDPDLLVRFVQSTTQQEAPTMQTASNRNIDAFTSRTPKTSPIGATLNCPASNPNASGSAPRTRTIDGGLDGKTLITPLLLNLLKKLSNFSPRSTASDTLLTAIHEEWCQVAQYTLDTLEAQLLVCNVCKKRGSGYGWSQETGELMNMFWDIAERFDICLLAGEERHLERMKALPGIVERVYWRDHLRVCCAIGDEEGWKYMGAMGFGKPALADGGVCEERPRKEGLGGGEEQGVDTIQAATENAGGN